MPASISSAKNRTLPDRGQARRPRTDGLRRGAVRFVEGLGSQVLGDASNAELSASLVGDDEAAARFYRELQWTLARLAFVLVAHERGLLAARSGPGAAGDGEVGNLIARVRGCEGRASASGGLWDAVRSLFDALGCEPGASSGAFPGIGSRLFLREHTPMLAGASVGDAGLIECVHRLEWAGEAGEAARVDWGRLEACDIGSAYESLLGLAPSLVVAAGHPPALRLTRVRESIRARGGSFYTPGALVEHMLDEALGPIITETCARVDRPADRCDALLALRICDPACGSGNFLVRAARRLAEHVARAMIEAGEHEPSVRARAREAVVGGCVHGVDIDPLAVELCKLSLWFEFAGPGDPVSLLDERVRCGDALIGATGPLVSAGVPDHAFEFRLGEDRACVSRVRGRNALERRARAGGSLLHAAATFNRRSADAWCAAFFARPPTSEKGDASFITDADVHRLGCGTGADERSRVRVVEELARVHRFFHWAIEFPRVFDRPVPGFDLVLGNPPFLNRLESATASARARANVIRALTGGAIKRYADEASAFLAVGMQLLRPGGRLALVQPQSVLSGSDGVPVRHALLGEGMLESVWVADERVFADASVFTCVLVLRRGGPGRGTLRRSVGSDFRPLAPIEIDADVLSMQETWSELVASAFGIPEIVCSSERTLADVATATADFRDQYYGLAGFVFENADLAEHERADVRAFPPIVTSGLIDLARCRWGRCPTRLLRRAWRAPRVDRARMARDGALGPWVDARLVPKILLATQTRVMEVFVDEKGIYLPSVPVVTITPKDPGMLWHVAAALASPVCSALAMRRYAGAALHHDAIKLSAGQVLTLPLPSDDRAWARASESFRSAQQEAGEDRAAHAVVEFGRRSCEAYGVSGDDPVLGWWCSRLGLGD